MSRNRRNFLEQVLKGQGPHKVWVAFIRFFCQVLSMQHGCSSHQASPARPREMTLWFRGKVLCLCVFFVFVCVCVVLSVNCFQKFMTVEIAQLLRS